jgi:hypothetical protein
MVSPYGEAARSLRFTPGHEECRHEWTFRSRNRRFAHIRYQDDHLFASENLARRLEYHAVDHRRGGQDERPLGVGAPQQLAAVSRNA